MNPLDPDYKPTHRKGRQGRLPKPDLAVVIGDMWDQPPDDHDRQFAGFGLGLEPDEVPEFDTRMELQVWVFRMHALRGSKEHFQELGDRAAPKPSRVTKADTGSTRGKTSGAPKSEAEKWFAAVDGDASQEDDTSPDAEDFEELM